MRKILSFLIAIPFLFVFAFGIEFPAGVVFGDVVIGNPDEDIMPAIIDPPPGSEGVPNSFTFKALQYYSGSTSSTATNITTTDSDGYYVVPPTSYPRPDFLPFQLSDELKITKGAPFWYWMDIYVTTTSGVPAPASVVAGWKFWFGGLSIPSSESAAGTRGAFVPLTDTDYFKYDASTGHLSGYLLFDDGIPRNITAPANTTVAKNGFYCIGFLGTNANTYQYRISPLAFFAERDSFTPGTGGGGGEVEPDPPTFEEQVLKDLENIQDNQDKTIDAITAAGAGVQSAITGSVDRIDGNFEGAVNPGLDDSLSKAEDGFQQIEDFEESLFDDMDKYKDDVDPSKFTFDPSIVSALGWVSHIWVDCFDQLGIWQPIITFPMFFGLALLIIGRGFQASVSTQIRAQRSQYLRDLNRANVKREIQLYRMGK